MAEPRESEEKKSQWYPVHWAEGMFLRPHHLQAADRYARQELKASEDWYHPFNYGFRSIDLDRDALRNFRVVLQGCEARFEDGTRVSIPADGVPDPIVLNARMFQGGEEVVVRLAVPKLRDHEGRGNVDSGEGSDGCRYQVQAFSIEDQNTGSNEQEVEVHRLRCRMLLDGQGQDGYKTIPLARVILSSEEGTPIVDPTFVPPLVIMEGFPPLVKQVRALHHQISRHIDDLLVQLSGLGRLYETQDTGEAERILKLAVLNGAFSYFESLAYTHGMTPLVVYQELCRLAGSLAIFTPTRRPGNLPRYRHDDLGECFARVIYAIRRCLEMAVLSAFEKHYFEGRAEGLPQKREIDRLRVAFVKDWRDDNRSLYVGVEGIESELSSQECQLLIRKIELKLGGATTADTSFTDRLRELEPILVDPERRPRVLPSSFVYYRIKGEEATWLDVINSKAMVLRFNPTKVKPEEEPGPAAASGEPEQEKVRVTRILNVAAANVASRKVRFALFIV